MKDFGSEMGGGQMLHSGPLLGTLLYFTCKIHARFFVHTSHIWKLLQVQRCRVVTCHIPDFSVCLVEVGLLDHEKGPEIYFLGIVAFSFFPIIIM